MNEAEFITQAEHVSDIFTKIMLKTMTVGLLAEGLDCDITTSQFQALKHVAKHGPCTVGSLADGLAISQPAATMLVDRMVKRSFVKRGPGRSDRRQAELSLTPRARELVARAESERARRLSEVLGLMKPHEREQLLRSLERFVGAALQLERAVDEVCLHCGVEHHADCVVNRMHLKLAGTHVMRT